MQVRQTTIEGLIELIPRVFEDERGHFFESYNKPLFTSLGIPVEFVQDNQSFSVKGVLRGLHYQNEPFAQGKLVRVITGQVLDVAVDLREDSPTFGQYETFLLDARLNNMAWIPTGFRAWFCRPRRQHLQLQMHQRLQQSGRSRPDLERSRPEH